MDKHFLRGIDTVIMRVSDIDKSKTWYIEKLGLQNIHEDETLRLVVLDTYCPTSLTLWETKDTIQNNPGATTYPIFSTPDAKAAREQLLNRGVSVGDLTIDHVVTYFTVFDPDNNVLEVCQVHS